MIPMLVACAAALIWFLPIGEAVHCRGRIGRLDRKPVPTAPLPSLSVVLAARNEEETIEVAMRTLLATDYPDPNIVAVDDRSEDGTGAILDRLSAEDPRLQVEHVRELPAGWLGKNHALHAGSLRASGEILLFTDADVHFGTDALLRAVGYCQAECVDHLVVFPKVILRGFLESSTVVFLGLALSFYSRPWRAGDPGSGAYIGIGAFNMVRASVYRRMGGHASLPMDVADDLKLGKRMKAAGGRAAILISGGLVQVRWVNGVRGLIRGLKKNFYAGFGYSPALALAGAAGLVLMACGPLVSMADGGEATRVIAGSTMVAMCAAAAAGADSPSLWTLAAGFPAAGIILAISVLGSMAHVHRHGGVVWRGTLYKLDELRRGVI